MSVVEKSVAPKVSVCILTYNRDKYIAECLQSIVDQQTDFEFEIIIGDDGSTDNTRAVISEFAAKYPNIKPIFREENIGGSQNYVDVHNRASGEFVCHCDDDDRWLPDKLSKQVAFLEANPDYSVVWTRSNYFDDHGRYVNGREIDYSFLDDNTVTINQALRIGAVAVHSSIMYRSSARKTRHLEVGADVLDVYYIWEFLLSGKGKILDDELIEYRIFSKGSWSSNSGTANKRLYAIHADDYLTRFPQYRNDIFIFVLFNLLADIKNRRDTWWLFAKIVCRSFSLVSPFQIIEGYKIARKMVIPKVFFED